MTTTRNPKTAKPKPRKGRPTNKPVGHLDLSDPATTGANAGSAKAKPLSGLDAASQILREASEPLDAQVLVARMLERGLWKTGGKTPASTIYAAMIREIKTKGPVSRFQKVDRGRFTATG